MKLRSLVLVAAVALALAWITVSYAQEACVVETASGEVAVIHPNWNRYTTDPAEVGPGAKVLIDLDDFCLAAVIKQPGLIGRQPFHDIKEDGQDEALREPGKWLQRNPGHPFSAKLRAAKTAADALKRQRIDRTALPERDPHRRGAWRTRPGVGGKLEVFDDRTVTTGLEVKAAIRWKEEQIASQPGAASSALEKKLAFGKPWLLTQGELNGIVDEWRAALPDGHKAKFAPPAGRKDAPLPRRPR